MKSSGLLTLSFVLILLAAGIAGCTTQNGHGTGDVTTGVDRTDLVHLTGGDYGYPQPFTIYPRGPGSSKVTMIL